MRYLFSLFLASALVGSAWGQTVVPPPPKLPVVTLPNPPAPPVPVPTPGTAFLLKPGVLYVIPSTGPVGVTSSPLGFVNVVAAPGPITMWGVFSDSKDGKPELRNYKQPNVYIVTAANPGSCELLIFRSTDVATLIRQAITTGEPPPPPPPPDPPGPKPPPPPPPGPLPPIPVDGFRVLIVYETAELSKLPKEQLPILYGPAVRDYMTSKAAVGADGKTKEWRIWDKDVTTANESKLWQDAMARPRTAVPWVIISNGKTGFEGPLPANEADMLTLLKKFGG